MTSLRTLSISALLAVALGGCIVTTDDNDSTLTVDNQSSFVLDEVHVAAVSEDNWGPNLVPEALFPGESVDISLTCDTYDVLVVDETGVECVLSSFDLCF